MKKKSDFRIEVDGNRVTILLREKFFWFIDIWYELTAADTEHGPEEVLVFGSVEEAESFIENICRADK